MKETRKGKRKIMRAARLMQEMAGANLKIKPVALNTYPDRTVSLVLRLEWREGGKTSLMEWIEIPYYKGRSERHIRTDMWEQIVGFGEEAAR